MTAQSRTQLPLPPREFLSRTGRRFENRSDEWLRDFYLRTGRVRRQAIEAALPEGFGFEGRRVLDFGCGAGRVLRQFAPEAESGEFWGCDLYEPTVTWLQENLSPPFRFYVNAERPMPHPDEHFDLVYAISVFTHITGEWAEWMLELRRILKPDGLLLATFIGPRSWENSLKRTVGEDELGIAMLRLDQSYADTSGPLVLHSPWWIRAHWSRAFAIETLWPHGFAWPRRRGETQEELDVRLGDKSPGHGVFVGRKRPGTLTADDLERPEPGDPREEAARRQQGLIADEERSRRQRRRPQGAARAPRPPLGPGG
jgi:SAM-dependent methyltransferase